MSIIVLTGPIGAGQHAVARAFAKQQERCAVIDADLVRWMVLQPHPSTWEGEEAERLDRLGVRNVCALARQFANEGFLVLVLDVLSHERARLYRQELAGVASRIVLLLPALSDLLQRRAETRPHGVTSEDIIQSYRAQQQLNDYDLLIDTPGLTSEEIAARLGRA